MTKQKNTQKRSSGKGKEYVFENREALAHTLAHHISQQLIRGIEQKGQASLLVSGGSSPVAVFEALSDFKLEWDKVKISLVDERWVPPDHLMSNESLVREHLLKSEASKATFIPLFNGEATPEEGSAKITSELEQISTPIDAIILGMGEDGHTASLFPCSNELEEGLNPDSGLLCLAAHPQSAPLARMTWSYPALMNSKCLYLLITGQSKWKVYQEALKGHDEAAIREMPIRAFLHQDRVNLDVFYAE